MGQGGFAWVELLSRRCSLRVVESGRDPEDGAAGKIELLAGRKRQVQAPDPMGRRIATDTLAE